MASRRKWAGSTTTKMLAYLAGSLLGLGWTARTATGQDTVRVSAGSECRECAIRLVPEVTLGAPDGPATVGFTFVVAATSSHLFVAPIQQRGRLKVFDQAGRFVRTLEFLVPGDDGPRWAVLNAATTRDDTLFLADVSRRRLLAVGPELEAKEVVGLPGLIIEQGLRPLPGDPGSYFVNAVINTPESVGLPLHLLDSRARVRRSFDDDVGVYHSGDDDLRLYRWMHLGERGDLWVAHMHDYRIEHWPPESERPVTVYLSEPAWFRLPVEPPAPGVEGVMHPAPQSQLTGLWFDAATETLLVLGRTRDEDWRDAVGDYWIDDFTDYWDSVVELIHVPTGRLLASQISEEVIHLGFLDDGRLYSLREDSGFAQIEISRVVLQGVNTKGGIR